MIIQPIIPYPCAADGTPLVFNTMVEGYDVKGRPVHGVVRGYGPPAGYYNGAPGYPASAEGPRAALILVHTAEDTYMECYADDLTYLMSMGPSPYEVGCAREDGGIIHKL